MVLLVKWYDYSVVKDVMMFYIYIKDVLWI